MPTTSGFTHTPITLLLLLGLVTTSTLTSILDLKHFLSIHPRPHLWPHLQFSRFLTYQLAYLNSSELLFTSVLLYHLRVLERLWGSRKWASFVLCCGGVLVIAIPTVVVLSGVVTGGRYNYLPAGTTGLVTAGLACWREEVPVLYRYRILTGAQRRAGSREGPANTTSGVTLTDKATLYVLAVQLALSQFPYNLLPAGVGWVVGAAWRGDLLPAGMGRWRVPGWVVGEAKSTGKDADRERYAGLRRRLEEEQGAVDDGMRAATSGQGGSSSGTTDTGGVTSRGIAGTVREYFRGLF